MLLYDFSNPTLVLNASAVKQNYLSFEENFRGVDIYYAVKANPDNKFLETLVSLGSGFDAASLNEIVYCLGAGASPNKISFGNTIKSIEHISKAYSLGVRLFAADSEAELAKIALHAPHSDVYIRFLVENDSADWSLGRKFGCVPSKVVSLLKLAKSIKLNPIGISFHVGSQTRHPAMWDNTLNTASSIWMQAQQEGIQLHLLNIGGGFPIKYHDEITSQNKYAKYLIGKIETSFPGITRVMAEPGRALVSTAGYLVSKILLVSDRGDNSYRWVYLNVGRFSGLAETESEAIRYRFSVLNRSNEMAKYRLAGPTCDSADILYERNVVSLPIDIDCEDTVIIHDCGAYTSTYSSVNFNGFEPLAVIHE